jgi:hypothetical protein
LAKQLPSRYGDFVSRPQQAMEFLQAWTKEREVFVNEIAPHVTAIGLHFKLEGLSFRRIERSEVSAIELPHIDRIYKWGINVDEPSRTEFAREMAFVESAEDICRAVVTSREPVTGLAALESLASVRSNFAANVNAKLSTERRQVRVIANTVDADGKAANDFEIMYVLALWEGVEDKHRPFPNFSTPSEHTIGPGRYVFYCRKKYPQGTVNGEKRYLDITGDTPFQLRTPVMQ